MGCGNGRFDPRLGDLKDRRVSARVKCQRLRAQGGSCVLGAARIQTAKDFDVITPLDAERPVVEAAEGQKLLTDVCRTMCGQPHDGETSLHETGLADNFTDNKIAAAIERQNALPTDELNKLRAIARVRGLKLARALGVRTV